MSGGKFVKARQPLTRKIKWLLVLNAALLLLAGVFFWAYRHRSTMLLTQSAAEHWRGDNELRYAQISVFLPVDAPKSVSDVMNFRGTVESAMLSASLDPAQTQYREAYSGTVSVSVNGPHGSATVKTLGVGGDFFLFHPLRLVSGSYISDYDYMTDRVVLDEELAWTLFGSSDVAGLTVEIAGREYPVAGVVHRESDAASRKAYTETSGMFMNYDALNAISEVPISCYETVLPDPISGFAKKTVEDGFPVSGGIVVENTGRFTPVRLWTVLKGLAERAMNTRAVIYPYWENAARLCEGLAAIDLLAAIVLALCPAVCAAILLFVLVKNAVVFLWKKVYGFADGRIEARKAKRYEKNRKKGI